MSDVLLGWVIPIIHILSCLFLIVVVLLQTGKGADMGAVFGGGSQTLFGSGGAGNFLTRLTTATAIVFMLTSLVLTYGKTPTVRSGILDKLPAPAALPEATPPAGTGTEPAVPGAGDTAPPVPGDGAAAPTPGAGATAPAPGGAVPAPQEPSANAPAPAPVAAAPQAAPPAGAAKAEPAAPAAQAPAAEPAKPAAKEAQPAPAKKP